jgi:putative hydrolase of the HAD superfamily
VAGKLRTRAAKPPDAEVEAVLLDSFGTLVEMEPPGPLLAEALGVPVKRAEAAFRAEIAYYLEHHGEGRDAASLDALRDRCASVLRDTLGMPSPDLPTIRAAMLDSIRFHAYPDTAPALIELRHRGIKLVVASNWDCSLPQVLEEAGLLPLVDGVVASAVAGADKPDAAVFEAALELAGCDASRAVHVGDSADKDVAGARAAGIRALLIDRSGRGGDISSLAALPRIL